MLGWDWTTFLQLTLCDNLAETAALVRRRSSSARLKITSPELVRACTDHRLVTSSVTLVWRPPPLSERHEEKLYVVRIAKTSCWYRTTKGTTLSGIGTLTKRRLVSNAPNHPRAQAKPKTTNRAHCKENRSREQRSAARNSAAMCSRFKVCAPSTQSTVCWPIFCNGQENRASEISRHPRGACERLPEGCRTVDRKRRWRRCLAFIKLIYTLCVSVLPGIIKSRNHFQDIPIFFENTGWHCATEQGHVLNRPTAELPLDPASWAPISSRQCHPVRNPLMLSVSVSVSVSAAGAGRPGQSPRRDSQALCLTSSGLVNTCRWI